MANSYESMCNVLNKVNDAGERSGLKLNAKKTKVMHINCKDTHDPINVNGHDFGLCFECEVLRICLRM